MCEQEIIYHAYTKNWEYHLNPSIKNLSSFLLTPFRFSLFRYHISQKEKSVIPEELTTSCYVLKKGTYLIYSESDKDIILNTKEL